MINHLFLIPVYNDWQSLNLLIKKINEEIGKRGISGDILIIDDNSSENISFKLNVIKNINQINVLRLNKNLGSQSGIAIGLKYLSKENKENIITILDSDGEDDPAKINEMIEIAKQNNNTVVTSNRTNRKENPIFKTLYFFHKVFTFFFTAKWISFGNFSSFHSKNLDNILRNNNPWLAISSAIAINSNIIRLYAKRQKRYFGESKVNFLSLMLHSLRVISVFYKRLFISSCLYSFVLIYSFTLYKKTLSIFLVAIILIFNFLILFIRKMLKPKNLENWENYVEKIENLNKD